jgi:DNA-binding NarL/FixJ family response regulator
MNDDVTLSLFRASWDRLSRRQKDAITATCRTGSRADAAAAMFVTEDTIRTTLSAAYVVLGAKGGKLRTAQVCYFLGQMAPTGEPR